MTLIISELTYIHGIGVGFMVENFPSNAKPKLNELLEFSFNGKTVKLPYRKHDIASFGNGEKENVRAFVSVDRDALTKELFS